MQSASAGIVRKISKLVSRKTFHTKQGLTAEAKWIEGFLKKHATVSQAPVVLISQVQRSGGTLLSQLLDDHSQVANYPGELKFGPDVPEDRWPTVDFARSFESTFRCLQDHRLGKLVQEGFTKSTNDPRRYPFVFFPTLHRTLFLHACSVAKPATPRALFNIYFSTFFSAWLNCRTSIRKAKVVTAFAPRLASSEKDMHMFFADYPDGRLIQVLRDPRSWLLSAKRHRRTRKRSLSDEDLMRAWSVSTASMIRNRRSYGASVVIVPFERLITDTGAVMQSVCGQLGLEHEPALNSPTFNGDATIANSSFAVADEGVIADPLSRGSAQVETARVGDAALRLYEDAAREAIAGTA